MLSPCQSLGEFHSPTHCLLVSLDPQAAFERSEGPQARSRGPQAPILLVYHNAVKLWQQKKHTVWIRTPQDFSCPKIDILLHLESKSWNKETVKDWTNVTWTICKREASTVSARLDLHDHQCHLDAIHLDHTFQWHVNHCHIHSEEWFWGCKHFLEKYTLHFQFLLSIFLDVVVKKNHARISKLTKLKSES